MGVGRGRLAGVVGGWLPLPAAGEAADIHRQMRRIGGSGTARGVGAGPASWPELWCTRKRERRPPRPATNARRTSPARVSSRSSMRPNIIPRPAAACALPA